VWIQGVLDRIQFLAWGVLADMEELIAGEPFGQIKSVVLCFGGCLLLGRNIVESF
jgi:hypothetical protein